MIHIHPVHMIILLAGLLAFAILRSAYVARRHTKERAALATGDSAGVRDEMAVLKDRLAVLERIAVEKENSLEREIEKLRDK